MIVIGIDQSYTRTGIAIVEDNTLIKLYSMNFKKVKSKAEKRNKLREKLRKILKRYTPDKIIVERVRQFSAGFMSMNAIACHISITTAIIDVAYEFNLEVVSVDTRSWKSQVLGTSKPKNGDKKYYAKQFIEKLGWEIDKNDDVADAACIAFYGFIPIANQKLKVEK